MTCRPFKKANLDQKELAKFQPVSNLPFWGKMIEKVVSVQLQKFLDMRPGEIFLPAML